MRERTESVLTYGAVAAMACGVALALAPGARGSPDSTNYLNAALHLAAGHGYVTSTLDAFGPTDLAPLTVFPPGFSLALASLLSLGLAPRAAITWLLGASYVAYALTTCAVLRASLPTWLRRSAPLVTAAIIVQAPVLEGLNAALSDLLGAAAALAAMAFSMRRERSTRSARILGVLLGASVWVRWANLYLAVGIGLALALSSERRCSLRARLSTVFEVARAAALTVLPLWARNLILTHTLMGPRTHVASSPLDQVNLALQGAGAWFASAHDAVSAYPMLSTAHAALGLALGLMAVVALMSTDDAKTRTLGLVSAGYALLMVLSSSTVLYDPLSDSRFWLPVLPLGTAAWLRALATVEWPRGMRLATAAAWVLLVTHATTEAVRSIVIAAAGEQRPSQYFAEALDVSENLQRALILHDAGVCELATDDEFALLPRVGTRPLRKIEVDALHSLSRREGKYLCLLLMAHDLGQAASAPYAMAHASMLYLQAHGHATLEHIDATSELWLTAGMRASERVSHR